MKGRGKRKIPPPTSGIVLHGSHMQKSGMTHPGIEPEDNFLMMTTNSPKSVEEIVVEEKWLGVEEVTSTKRRMTWSCSQPHRSGTYREKNPADVNKELEMIYWLDEMPIRNVALAMIVKAMEWGNRIYFSPTCLPRTGCISLTATCPLMKASLVFQAPVRRVPSRDGIRVVETLRWAQYTESRHGRMSPLKEAPWDMCITERGNEELQSSVTTKKWNNDEIQGQGKREHPGKTSRTDGAAVTKWLACSPPTKANRVQSPDGLRPDFRIWESCRTMPLVGGFSPGSHLYHPYRLSIQFERGSFGTQAHIVPESCRCVSYGEVKLMEMVDVIEEGQPLWYVVLGIGDGIIKG
ncbi:hypothetical protein PR048_021858 [Dryococelus australis]|uniref:Uncharacterized protein n=1 Tax=Dryococelus australis TaxID=614101 RepID=A0ABQ9GZE0_9NEOP|nr:hypothetical protein PR048_021858 [Dryococelus australis]